MAIIFDFKAIDSSARTPQARPGDTKCQVILFPGVRYERWETPQLVPSEQVNQSERAQPRKRRAKKRALQMAE